VETKRVVKRVVLIGSNGQLGTDLVKELCGWDLSGLTHQELDICDLNRARMVLSKNTPEAVINTAAYNRVDDCESEVEKAFQINAFGVRNLAQVCTELDCVLVHLSSDYIFGGEKREPYREDDTPNPLSVYGTSKLAGEYFVRNVCRKHFIVRTSGLFGVAGSSGKGGNFVETMIRLAREGKPIRVVDDQITTPTYTKDLAHKIRELLLTNAYGMYHVTSSGHCSWYEFAEKIFEFLGLRPDIGPTPTEQYGQRARRPSYSVLAHDKIRELRLDDMSPWPKGLELYLSEKGY